MTDDTRAELRPALEQLVRLVDAIPEPVCRANGVSRPAEAWVEAHTYAVHLPPGGLPPLTPFQQMCLSGLLGDEAQLPQAVADYLLDQGHEYATACYERGKRDVNPFL